MKKTVFAVFAAVLFIASFCFSTVPAFAVTATSWIYIPYSPAPSTDLVAQYKRNADGTVVVQGKLLKYNTTANAYNYYFTLPVGFRPSQEIMATAFSTIPGTMTFPSVAKLNSDGKFSIYFNNKYASVISSFNIVFSL